MSLNNCQHPWKPGHHPLTMRLMSIDDHTSGKCARSKSSWLHHPQKQQPGKCCQGEQRWEWCMTDLSLAKMIWLVSRGNMWIESKKDMLVRFVCPYGRSVQMSSLPSNCFVSTGRGLHHWKTDMKMVEVTYICKTCAHWFGEKDSSWPFLLETIANQKGQWWSGWVTRFKGVQGYCPPKRCSDEAFSRGSFSQFSMTSWIFSSLLING